jgi:DNA-binding winged helix-turn-helix (wHTH) protein
MWESSLSAAFGPFEIDARSRTLRRGASLLRLQAKPFDLLLYLIAHRERVVGPSELLDALWPGIHVTPAALSRAVYKLRRALGDTREPRSVVATIHGRGFRFVAPLRAAVEAGAEPIRLGDGAAGAIEGARLALESALRALAGLRSIDPMMLDFVGSLTRDLCGLVLSIAAEGRSAERAGPAASRSADPVPRAGRGLRAV